MFNAIRSLAVSGAAQKQLEEFKALIESARC